METNMPVHSQGNSSSLQTEPRLDQPACADKRHLCYLCFQATKQGQASHAHVHEIISGLERTGWRVTLFEPDYGPAPEPPALTRRIAQYLPTQFRLWRASPRPKVLYVRAHPAALPSLIWARLRRIVVVEEVNGTFDDLRLMYPGLWPVFPLIYGVSLLCLALADGIITVTNELRQWLETKVIGKSIAVVPNGANTELFHPGEAAEEMGAEPYVAYVGAMSPWQGLETMLAAASLPEWPAAVRLVLVGSGVEQSKAEAAAAVNEKIIYLGRREYRKIPAILRGAVAGLSVQNTRRQSHKCGFSALKVFETLACGVPAIVTDFPGQRELVRDTGSGIVIPPDDPLALAKAVKRLSSNPEMAREMGRRGRDAILSGHSWQRRAESTSHAICQAIARKSGAC
jgi:glycosyltransferase involved in cell wall biosynthesis